MTAPLTKIGKSEPQYVYQVQSLINSGAWNGIGRPSYADARDEDFGEKLRLDPVASLAMEQFRAEVAGAEARMIAASEDELSVKAAEVVQEGLLDAIDIHEALDEFANAPMSGAEYGTLEWGDPSDPEDDGTQYRELADLPGQYWRIPTRIHDIHRHRVRYRIERDTLRDARGRATAGPIRQFTEIYSFERGQWEQLEDEAWLIRHVIGNDEYHLGYGSALMDSLYNISYAETIAYRELANWIERWGQGQVVLQMDVTGTNAPDTSSDSEAETMIRRAKDLRGRDIAIIGLNDKWNVFEPQGTGLQAITEFIEHCQQLKVRRILGALLPTGGGSDVGSNARGKVERASQDRRIRFHRRRLMRTFQLYVVQRWWIENFPQLVECGLRKAKIPRFVIEDEPVEPDLLKEAQTDEVLSRMGLSLSVSDLRERYKRAAPKDEMDALKPVPAPSPLGLGLSPAGAPAGMPPMPGDPGKEE